MFLLHLSEVAGRALPPRGSRLVPRRAEAVAVHFSDASARVREVPADLAAHLARRGVLEQDLLRDVEQPQGFRGVAQASSQLPGSVNTSKTLAHN